MPHILVVCTANICRSPVGEAILRERLQRRGLTDWTVASAGTWGLNGHGASEHGITIMAEQGLDLQTHRARTVTDKMLAESDLIVCMEFGHVEAIKVEFPHYSEKVFLLSEMIGKQYSISDPYGGAIEGYRRMVKDVTNIIDEGLERIMNLAKADK